MLQNWRENQANPDTSHRLVFASSTHLPTRSFSCVLQVHFLRHYIKDTKKAQVNSINWRILQQISALLNSRIITIIALWCSNINNTAWFTQFSFSPISEDLHPWRALAVTCPSHSRLGSSSQCRCRRIYSAFFLATQRVAAQTPQQLNY